MSRAGASGFEQEAADDRRKSAVGRHNAGKRWHRHTKKPRERRVVELTPGNLRTVERSWRERVELREHAGGFETTRVLYHRLWRRQYAGEPMSSKRQLAAALAKGGRPRCPRTVRRHLLRLEAMGILRCYHVRRSGARAEPLKLDCLRVIFMSPPATRSGCNASLSSRRYAKAGVSEERAPPTAPDTATAEAAAETITPAAPADCSDKEEVTSDAAQIRDAEEIPEPVSAPSAGGEGDAAAARARLAFLLRSRRREPD